jgi:hypothetical protein
MKKKLLSATEETKTKKGYNEKNPAQPQGPFPPDAADGFIFKDRTTRRRLNNANEKVNVLEKKNKK